MAKKLICDRCGLELTEKDDIEIALEGGEAWETAVRGRGGEPRGVLPCKNYIRCGGEMQLVEDKKPDRWHWLHRKSVDK